MGVVHLARKPDGPRVALKILRPHIVGDDEARRRLAREVSSLERIRSRWIAEIVDADPWAATPYVATRYVPGLSLHDHVPQEGPITGPDLAWFAQVPGRGRGQRPRRRRAPPRRQAVERAPRGAHPDPHRLRSRAGRRRPQADPHRLAARHPGLPRARDPVRRRRDHGVRRPLLGGDRRLRRHRTPAVRTRSVDGDHGPGPPWRARPRRPARRPQGRAWRQPCDPDPARRPGFAEIIERLGGESAAGATPRHRPRRTRTRSRCRWPWSRSSDSVARTEVAQPAPTRHLPLPTRHPPIEAPAGRTVRPPARPRAPAGHAERRRSGSVARLVVAALGLLCGGATARWPYGGLTLVLVVSWLLRTCTLTVTAHGDRRRLRGARWYDVLVAPLSAPWYLVAALPGALLLGVWALGIGVAGALLCYAVGLSTSATLFVTGLCVAGGLWRRAGRRPALRWPVRSLAQAVASAYRAMGRADRRDPRGGGVPGPSGLGGHRLESLRKATARGPLSPRRLVLCDQVNCSGGFAAFGSRLARRSVPFFLPGLWPGALLRGRAHHSHGGNIPMTSHVDEKPTSPMISRRAVARGAAWSVPVVALAVAAPASASASHIGTCVTGLLDWDSFKNGSTQTGANLSPGGNTGVTLRVTTSGDDGAKTNGQVTKTTTGGKSSVMRFYDEIKKKDTSQTVTITFSKTVRNVSFSLLDVDSSTDNYEDLVQIVSPTTYTGVTPQQRQGGRHQGQPLPRQEHQQPGRRLQRQLQRRPVLRRPADVDLVRLRAGRHGGRRPVHRHLRHLVPVLQLTREPRPAGS